MEVLEPEALRDGVKAEARRLARTYGWEVHRAEGGEATREEHRFFDDAVFSSQQVGASQFQAFVFFQIHSFYVLFFYGDFFVHFLRGAFVERVFASKAD